MKEPDPANFVTQILYGIIGLFAILIIGGSITALVVYTTTNKNQETDQLLPNPSYESPRN